MSRTEEAGGGEEQVLESYVGDVQIRAVPGDPDQCYRFEAPRHCGIEFADEAMARLYADVYFDVNGFEEEGTGERGVPPVIIQAGRDTLAAYLLTLPYTDEHWVGSFMAVQPGKVQRYVSRVRKRARNIRRRVDEHDEG